MRAGEGSGIQGGQRQWHTNKSCGPQERAKAVGDSEGQDSGIQVMALSQLGGREHCPTSEGEGFWLQVRARSFGYPSVVGREAAGGPGSWYGLDDEHDASCSHHETIS